MLMRQFVPASTQAINDRATAEFRQAELAQRALQIGDKGPAFTLPDARGNLVSSEQLLSSGPLIVNFIRGRWCPFCCATLEAWQGSIDQVKAAGASFVAITPMSISQCDFMRDQHKITFPILSDARNEVAEQFGVAYRLSEDQQELFTQVFINLPHVNGDDSWALPLPATFVAGRNGLITFSYVNEDYTQRAEPAEVVAALRA